MQFDNVMLIASAEVIAVLLIFCGILFYQNRALRKRIAKFKGRMEQLVVELRAAKKVPSPTPQAAEPEPPQNKFKDHLNDQLSLTKEHHASLKSSQDIVLDLSPETELPQRAAALRYAMLLAEKEAWANVEEGQPPKWEVLKFKYEQIFSFYEDYLPEPEAGSNDEAEALHQELLNAKKRINNLEKFKALFFDLEEKWEASKQTAQTHYDNLSQMAEKVDDRDAFETALNNYHSAYGDVSKLIEGGVEGTDILGGPDAAPDQKTAGELRHLRAVAADQHRIITGLQEKLKNAKNEEDREQIVNNLQEELDKQQRFVQESETCIQLMEDELKATNKELTQLKDRLKTLPSLKTQLQEAKEQRDAYELKMYALTSENRKLKKQAKEDSSASAITVDVGETSKLKKELTELETRYASLEEKYLDLKIQQ